MISNQARNFSNSWLFKDYIGGFIVASGLFIVPTVESLVSDILIIRKYLTRIGINQEKGVVTADLLKNFTVSFSIISPGVTDPIIASCRS
jgi:hypothetical protein